MLEGEMGVVIAFAPGLPLTGHGWVTTEIFWDYGFPFAWRNISAYPWSICYSLFINWLAFVLDVLFYMASGYVVVIIGYEAYHRSWAMKHPVVFLIAAGYVMVVTLFSAWYHSLPPSFIP